MAMTGGSLNFWSCPCSSFSNKARLQQYHTPPLLILSLQQDMRFCLLQAVDVVNHRRQIYCSAVQESSTSTSVAAAETKEMKAATEDTTTPAKPKAAAKAPAKALPQLMEEDVIPSLRETLEAQQDISDLDLSFNNNNLEGSFLKNGKRYSFWAFFPDGNINGPKGFSLSSYGMEVSTVEPFLVDEKKPTAKHVVFWVEKRLAAQGIIPVWQD